ncbi:MAG: c-type cytochrome [Planctomycetaceae bacterium]
MDDRTPQWRVYGFLVSLSVRPVVVLLVLMVSQVAEAQTLSQRLREEPVGSLAEAARQRGDAVRGAVLLTQKNLNCTGCHAAGVRHPIGPDLKNLGPETTDVSLVEALLEPSKVIRKGFESSVIVTTAGKVLTGRIVDQKPDQILFRETSGDFNEMTLRRIEIESITPSELSAMPENLVDQLASREQFLDLIRYVMVLAANGGTHASHGHSAGGKQIEPELQGVVLLKEFNCSACHADDVSKSQLTAKQAPNLKWSAGWIDPRFVRKFIADPSHVRPGTTMPDVLSGLAANERETAAEELSHYLATLSDRQFAVQAVDVEAVTRGRELFLTVGCVACHAPRDDSGVELIQEESQPLGHVRDKYNLDGLVRFLKDPLESRVSGRMPKMNLTHWEAIDVASYLLSGDNDETDAEPFQLNSDLAAKGKDRFQKLGCQKCHQLDSTENQFMHPSLATARVDKGCLSMQAGDWPKFSFTTGQREALLAALNRKANDRKPKDEIDVTLTGLRCLNCHQRDELGGVSAARDLHFHTADPNLGPQGRIPPPLTGVGAKLNSEWMRQVLVSGRTIRPYVLTRMPQYGAENVGHLVDLFPQVDQLPPVEHAAFEDQKEMRKIGAEMVGTGGLNCIVCHTFQLKRSANMSAVDLTEMSERLKKDWFYHYMRDPQQLSQNTIMPSFWPGGWAMRRDILNGESDLQIEAIWQYLLDGRQAPTPRGLIQEPLELVATDEAVMLRRSYPGVGKRGVGVGYPGQVNLVFDAEQMRLAMIWQGKFADAGGVWRSQGHGTVRPLGPKVMSFSPGPDIDDADHPWIVDEGRPPEHRFKGYSLDNHRRPTFRYEIGDVSVEDVLLDVADGESGRSFLRRTIRLKGASTSRKLTFRAATGKKIESRDHGDFVVDGQLTVHLDPQHEGKVLDAVDGQHLQMRLKFVDGFDTLIVEYRW